MPAIVANHFVLALVMRHRDGAVLALQRLAAGAAQHHRRISAPVEQHHDLLFMFQPLADFLRQLARDDLLVSGFLELLAHVDDFDFRQRTPLHAIRQLDQRILVFLGVEVRLQRGRGRSEHDNRARHLSPHHRHIARMIARRLFLFIRGILLFIDDDERQIADRREHRRPRSRPPPALRRA